MIKTRTGSKVESKKEGNQTFRLPQLRLSSAIRLIVYCILSSLMLNFFYWSFIYDYVTWQKNVYQIISDQPLHIFYLFVCTFALLIAKTVFTWSDSALGAAAPSVPPSHRKKRMPAVPILEKTEDTPKDVKRIPLKLPFRKTTQKSGEKKVAEDKPKTPLVSIAEKLEKLGEANQK